MREDVMILSGSTLIVLSMFVLAFVGLAASFAIQDPKKRALTRKVALTMFLTPFGIFIALLAFWFLKGLLVALLS